MSSIGHKVKDDGFCGQIERANELSTVDNSLLNQKFRQQAHLFFVVILNNIDKTILKDGQIFVGSQKKSKLKGRGISSFQFAFL